MRKLISIILLTTSIGIIHAQDVVSSAGDSYSAGGYEVSWTLGEPVIETISGSNSILTQGMHQTNLVVTSLQYLTFPGLEVKVYPNPTRDLLKIEVIQTGNDLFMYELFDIAGRKKVLKQMQSNSEEIDMNSYVSGIYMLHVLNPNREHVKVCKIIKQ